MLNRNRLLIAGIGFAIFVHNFPCVPRADLAVDIGLLNGTSDGYVGAFDCIPSINDCDLEMTALCQLGVSLYSEGA